MNDSFATRDELRVGDQTYEFFSLRRLGEQHAIERLPLSLIHISEPTRPILVSRMPSSA